jgi:hypothetical protein
VPFHDLQDMTNTSDHAGEEKAAAERRHRPGSPAVPARQISAISPPTTRSPSKSPYPTPRVWVRPTPRDLRQWSSESR